MEEQKEMKMLNKKYIEAGETANKSTSENFR